MWLPASVSRVAGAQIQLTLLLSKRRFRQDRAVQFYLAPDKLLIGKLCVYEEHVQMNTARNSACGAGGATSGGQLQR